MHNTSIFQLSKQEEICIHLENISKKAIDEQKAREMLKYSEYPNQFIIGNEIKSSSPEQNRYFQITPSVVFMKGIIKISKQGELSVSDACYSTNVNAKFLFDNNALKMNSNLEWLEKQNNKCVIL